MKKQRFVVAFEKQRCEYTCYPQIHGGYDGKNSEHLDCKEAMKEMQTCSRRPPTCNPTETPTTAAPTTAEAAAHGHVTVAVVEFVQLESPSWSDDEWQSSSCSNPLLNNSAFSSVSARDFCDMSSCKWLATSRAS